MTYSVNRDRPVTETQLLKDTITGWFKSDFDVHFVLEKWKKRLYCSFESDAYYFENKRYRGKYRRFIVDRGPDVLFEKVEEHTSLLYNEETIVELIDRLGYQFVIKMIRI